MGTAFTGTGSDPSLATYRDPSLWPQGYYSGDPLPLSTIYLSFDDGPTDFTSQILDILKAEKVKATFFINSYEMGEKGKANKSGNRLIRYRADLLRMVREGHVLGNHSRSHQDFSRLSPAAIADQLSTLQSQLDEALGAESPSLRLIRPPFGSPWIGSWNSDEQRKMVRDILKGRGIVTLWTIGWDTDDSSNWADGEWFEDSDIRYHPGSPAYEAKMRKELDRIFKWADGLASGVILMHDSHPTSRDTLKAMIVELKARGYSFATLEDYCRWRWGPGIFSQGR